MPEAPSFAGLPCARPLAEAAEVVVNEALTFRALHNRDGGEKSESHLLAGLCCIALKVSFVDLVGRPA